MVRPLHCFSSRSPIFRGPIGWRAAVVAKALPNLYTEIPRHQGKTIKSLKSASSLFSRTALFCCSNTDYPRSKCQCRPAYVSTGPGVCTGFAAVLRPYLGVPDIHLPSRQNSTGALRARLLTQERRIPSV
jgi:hypothetical protein